MLKRGALLPRFSFVAPTSEEANRRPEVGPHEVRVPLGRRQVEVPGQELNGGRPSSAPGRRDPGRDVLESVAEIEEPFAAAGGVLMPMVPLLADVAMAVASCTYGAMTARDGAFPWTWSAGVAAMLLVDRTVGGRHPAAELPGARSADLR